MKKKRRISEIKAAKVSNFRKPKIITCGVCFSVVCAKLLILLLLVYIL